LFIYMHGLKFFRLPFLFLVGKSKNQGIKNQKNHGINLLKGWRLHRLLA
jgi:hypothetical protein